MSTTSSNNGAVLHVVAAGEIGGAERMLIDLIRSSASSSTRKHSIALFTPNDALRGLFRDAGGSGVDVDDRGTQVREGPLPFLASTLGGGDVAWLSSTIAKRNARIVHLHTFASQVLGTRAAIASRARIVRTEHSTRVYEDPSCIPFSRWSLGRVDAVVCISEHIRKVALAAYPKIASRMSTIPNGVDVDRFAAIRPPPSNRSGTHFLALGRLDARKGLDLAIDAIAKVPRAELDIVGDGEERAALEEKVRRLCLLDRIRFRGFTNDVRDAIASADVALSSARTEGLGIALLEAMAMERPVVGVPVGGLLEIVREGDTGWLADVRSVDALARVIERAVVDPAERKRRGKRAREHVIARYSLSSMAVAYEQLYRSLDTREQP